MEFKCFNGIRNCDYCGSCHSEFKARTSDEKRRIYNQALEDLTKLVCEYYTMQERAGYCADTNNMIKQRVADFAEQLKR